MEKQYLGDGVYASFDGYHIVLEGNADGRKNVVYLEKPVMEALKRYAAALDTKE